MPRPEAVREWRIVYCAVKRVGGFGTTAPAKEDGRVFAQFAFTFTVTASTLNAPIARSCRLLPLHFFVLEPQRGRRGTAKPKQKVQRFAHGGRTAIAHNEHNLVVVPSAINWANTGSSSTPFSSKHALEHRDAS